MKYLAYLRQKEAHYAADKFLLDIIGIAQVTSETTESYGALTYEITGRGLPFRLESLVKQDGWRRGSRVINKNENIIPLTKTTYESLQKKIEQKIGRTPNNEKNNGI